MNCLTAVTTSVFETTVFLYHVKDMPDHRQSGDVAYRLDEILLLALLSILAGAEGFTDMARFGQKKLSLLQRFCPSPTVRRATTIWALSSPRSTRWPSRNALWPGLAR